MKKWVSPALAALLALVLLAGCGGSKNEGGASPTSSPVDTGAASATPAPAAETASAEPEVKHPLRALLNYATTDYNGSVPAKILEEKTGYQVTFDMLPQEKPEDKLNIIMASGEAYDVISISHVLKQQYFDYAKRGALTDLTPLIDQYGPNIKAAVAQKDLEAVMVDGKIYAIPTIGIANTSASIAIRVDWLEKLNLQMPTTLDELVTVLKAFKEQDPGGNGDKNIPLTAVGAGLLENIRGAFGLAPAWSVVDGQIVHAAAHPALKDYVAFVADLVKSGLLDKEFVTTKEATMLEKFSSGRAGAMIGGWSLFPTISTTIVKNFPEAKISYLNPLKGKDGQSGFALTESFQLYTVIPKASDHPEDAIKWINAKLDPETFKNAYIGIEGTHHTVQDGNYSPINPKFSDEFGNANNLLTGAIEQALTPYWLARVRKDEMLYQGWKTINSIPDEQKIRDPLAFAPFLPELAKNNAQLISSLNDYIIKTVINNDFDATYADFLKNWNAAGGEAVTKEVNDWYATR